MPDQPSRSTQGAASDLRELPPSAKLVAKTLEYEGGEFVGRVPEERTVAERFE